MATKSKGQQNIEDVAFILGEVKRVGAMDPKERKKEHGNHPFRIFMHLRHPTRGIIFCGEAAFLRFFEVARRTTSRGSLAETSFSSSEYVSALRQAFVELFIDQTRTVEQGSVQKLVNRAIDICRTKLVEYSHHAPCVLFFENEPRTFSLGPVTFTWCEQFLQDKDERFKEYRQRSLDYFVTGVRLQVPDKPLDEIVRDATDFADRELDQLREYYSNYRWVASVAIPGCHESLSLARAERTIDAALDVLRLLTFYAPGRYRRADAGIVPFNRYAIASDGDGKIAVSRLWERQGAQAGENWYTGIVNHAVMKKGWDLFSEAITPLTEGRASDHLNERILDALNWYGQAIVESNPGAKVVKFTAALERLTMTGHIKTNDIEASVIKRVMTLNQDRTDMPLDEIAKNLGRLYDCRSNLMHGTISPNDSSIEKVLPHALDATRWALCNAVQLFTHIRAAGKIDRHALGKVYDGGRVPKDPTQSS